MNGNYISLGYILTISWYLWKRLPRNEGNLWHHQRKTSMISTKNMMLMEYISFERIISGFTTSNTGSQCISVMRLDAGQDTILYSRMLDLTQFETKTIQCLMRHCPCSISSFRWDLWPCETFVCVPPSITAKPYWSQVFIQSRYMS